MTKEFKIFLGVLLAVGGAGYFGYLHNRINKIEDMITVAVDDLSETVEVNISDEMLETAMQKAVDREVKYIANGVKNEISAELRSGVKKSVHSSADDIKASVKTEIERQVNNIDISDMEREIVNQAKAAVADKFDRKLDNLLEEYNENLQNVKKIYGSIAKSITKD
jgi:hypothetical protein